MVAAGTLVDMGDKTIAARKSRVAGRQGKLLENSSYESPRNLAGKWIGLTKNNSQIWFMGEVGRARKWWSQEHLLWRSKKMVRSAKQGVGDETDCYKGERLGLGDEISGCRGWPMKRR